MRAADARSKTFEELLEMQTKLKKELEQSKEKILLGKEKKISTVRDKKDIARIQTILTEKTILQSLETKETK